MTTPLVFISYSHRDEEWKDRLVTHLGVLEQQGLLDLWDDRQIEGGALWREEISGTIANASVTVLLVSAHYLGSSFVLEQEVPKLLDRRERDGLRVFPIIVSPCVWESVQWLQRLQVRPVGARPLSTLGSAGVDEQLALIAGEIAACVSGGRDKTGSGPRVTIPPRRMSISRMPATGRLLVGRESELDALDRAWHDPEANVLSVIAWGGVGKSALMNRWLARLAKDQYSGAELVYAWSFYLQGTEDQLSADSFIAAALQWFGDEDPARGSEWDKGVRLAELVASSRTLMLLDGLEPVQHPPGPLAGFLRDKSLVAFLCELAANNPGLCVISSRLDIADLDRFADATVRRIELDCLSPAAGAELLRAYGVAGDPEELYRASQDYGGHGLALTLLGTYVRDVHGGDITQRHAIVQLEQDDRQGGHARRVLESYERWLRDDPALSVLSMVGVFDRPARAEEMASLRNPPIRGLNERLRDISVADWSRLLQRLRSSQLLLPSAQAADGDEFDAHPLVREYFSERLRCSEPHAWTEANARLYEFFRDTAPDLPDDLEIMDRLFRAVAFGCRAGRYHDALHEVYLPRIMRNADRYATSVLGANSAVLSTLAHFFQGGDWNGPTAAGSTPDQTIGPEDRLTLLTHVGPALLVTKGWSSAEVVATYDKAREICLEIGDSHRMFHVTRGLWSYYSIAGKLPQARELALDLMGIADADGSTDFLVEAYMAIGHTEFWSGNFEVAVAHLESSFELYEFEAHHDSHTNLYGEDPAAIYACYKPVSLGVLGFPDQGERVVRNSLRLSEKFRHNFSKGLILYGAAWFYAQHQDAAMIENYASALGNLAAEYGFVGWAALARTMRGWAASLTGRTVEGIAEMSAGLSAWTGMGCGVKRVFFATLLADACLRGGQLVEGKNWIKAALAAADFDGYYLPEVHRVNAELLHASGAAAPDVIALVREALRVAQAQRARLFELRAAVTLCRVTGKTSELRDVFNSFAEGFATDDLAAARATLLANS